MCYNAIHNHLPPFWVKVIEWLATLPRGILPWLDPIDSNSPQSLVLVPLHASSSVFSSHNSFE